MQKSEVELVVDKYLSNTLPEDFNDQEFLSFLIDIFKAASKYATASIQYKEVDLTKSQFYKIMKNLNNFIPLDTFGSSDCYTSDIFETHLSQRYNLLILDTDKVKITIFIKEKEIKQEDPPKILVKVTGDFDKDGSVGFSRYYSYYKYDITNFIEYIYIIILEMLLIVGYHSMG